MEDRLTVPEALEKLASHGSPAQMAQYLKEQGITGNPRSASSCLVSAYLNQVADLDTVTVLPSRCFKYTAGDVSTGTVSWVEGEHLWHSRRTSLPEEVDKLANLFDKGAFPELERGR